MKIFKIVALVALPLLMNSCASGYRTITPENLTYNSQHLEENISLEYKYDLLRKKYAKKEKKKDVRLVAIKITNNSEKDLIFGQDIWLTYKNNSQVLIMPIDKTFQSLKQHPVTYLPYLLLTPLNIYTTTVNSYGVQETSSSFPAGLIIGPGLAGGNLIAAASANKKFKNELRENNLQGARIPKGETVYGLIGIRADNYDALDFDLKDQQEEPAEKVITP